MAVPGTSRALRLHQRLGEGGMGVVHLGTLSSAAGDRLVAIKRLARRSQLDERAQARLIAEARLVFRLTHANICQVLDLGENEDGTFVVMEYVRGCDLQELLAALEREQRRIEPAMWLYVAREVARALDYAHRRVDDSGRALGIVHGDVTPQNILLSIEGEVKLADFGIARALDAHGPGSGVVGGTPGFMAPEARAGVIDHRADVYSLGATLHRALGGRRPGESGPVAEDLRGVAGVSPELVEIVARALATDPAGRWLSAGELERALATELSRRAPGFTPSAMASIVRAHARERRGAPGVPGELRTPDGSTDAFAMRTLLDRPDLVAPGDSTAPLPREAQASRTVTPAPDPDARPRTATAAPPPRPRRRPLVLLMVLGALALAGGALAWRSASSSASPPRAAAPQLAVKTAEGEALPTPTMLRPDPPPPAPAVDADAATGPDPATPAEPAPEPRRKRGDRRPDPPVAPPPALTDSGFLTVNATPWAAVFVDGKQVARETPLYRFPVSPGRHTVVVEYDGGGRSPAHVVDVAAGEHETLGFKR